MTTTQINIRLEDAHIAVLDTLAGKSLNRQAIGRMLLIAAIEAVQANGGMIPLPPQFAVGDKISASGTSYRLNEPAKRK